MSVVEEVRPVGDADGPVNRITFSTRAWSYIPLVLINLLLNLVTLTIYRFWGKTAIRRRLWAETSFAGEVVEYTGTGWELCKGFLIALLIFFVPFVAVYAATIFLDPIYMLVLAPAYLAAFVLVYAAIYFQRRYQLSRTMWRGIRFGLDGSAWSFSVFAIGQAALQIITLGWWGPTARQRIARCLWRNARYGDQHFSFYEGDDLAGKTYTPYAIGWVVGLLGYIGLIGAIVAATMQMGGPGALEDIDPNDPASMQRMMIFFGVIYGAVFAYAIVVGLAFLAYEAAAMRRTAELMSFGGTRFRHKATTMSLLGLLVSNLLLTILSLGLLFKVAEIRYWRYVIGRLEAVGDLQLARVAQSADRGPKSGEGLADGFDFGGV